MTQLLRARAGEWPNSGGNSNLVPVVAKGEVLAASYVQMRIYDLKATATKNCVAGSVDSRWRARFRAVGPVALACITLRTAARPNFRRRFQFVCITGEAANTPAASSRSCRSSRLKSSVKRGSNPLREI
jgi:hypothetical protein